ncbi:hypothetical protein HK405_004507, partial [Cladochytrium tenue]
LLEFAARLGGAVSASKDSGGGKAAMVASTPKGSKKSKKKDDDKFTGKCWACEKKGTYKAQHEKKDSDVKKEESSAAYTAATGVSPGLVLDSGMSKHFINDLKMFKTYTPKPDL